MNTLKRTLVPSALQHEETPKIQHPNHPNHQSTSNSSTSPSRDRDQMQALEQSTISPDPKVTEEIAGLMDQNVKERKDKNPFSEAHDLEMQREKRGWVGER